MELKVPAWRETSTATNVYAFLGRYRADSFPKRCRPKMIKQVQPPEVKVTDIPQNDISQNRRVMANLLRNHPASLPTPNFASGASTYGNSLEPIKAADENIWEQKSTSLLVEAQAGTAGARRMVLELRSIRRAAIPFMSAVPIGDSLDRILASIEGPRTLPAPGEYSG
jgi:hypothetical protein